MKTYIKLYVDYNRQTEEAGLETLANWLLLLADGVGHLYVDTYITEDDVENLPVGSYIHASPSSTGCKLLKRIPIASPISTYACIRVSAVTDLIRLWDLTSYSSPKVYRITQVEYKRNLTVLDGELVESFQWTPIESLSSVLDANVCILRDFHDDVGLEVLCRGTFEERVNILARTHLKREPTQIKCNYSRA